MSKNKPSQTARIRSFSGFTIVELLIVIVVIGILATLVLLAFTNVADQANKTKVTHDLRQLSNAIELARSNSGKRLKDITGSTATMYWCTQKPSGTDLAKLPKTDQCWVDYNNALAAIGAAANANFSNLVDPYGRPYYIDENEGDPSFPPCIPDSISEYSRPFQTGYVNQPNTALTIHPIDPACN